MSARPLVAAAVIGFVLGCGLGLPPRYIGHYWCFITSDAFGLDDQNQISSIHSAGGPFRACFCFCDDLHADSNLFTGPNAPQASQEWLDLMTTMREVAIDECNARAVELGLVTNNCADVMPALPALADEEAKCHGEPQEQGSYCTEPDLGKAEGGTDSDTSGASAVDRL